MSETVFFDQFRRIFASFDVQRRVDAGGFMTDDVELRLGNANDPGKAAFVDAAARSWARCGRATRDPQRVHGPGPVIVEFDVH